MKEKLKEFFTQKRELLLFIGVLLVVFTTVIVVANYALSEAPNPGDDPNVVVPGDDDDDVVVPGDDDDDDDVNQPLDPVYKVTVPMTGDFVIVRNFFDAELLSKDELLEAVINVGNDYIESRGVSYAKEDNSVFDVHTILPGTVINVQVDSLEGTIVTIQHDNNVISRYHALSSANVAIGDVLEANTVIGKAGTSILDNEAGIHVHLEILLDDEYINPNRVIGKTANEIISNK